MRCAFGHAMWRKYRNGKLGCRICALEAKAWAHETRGNKTAALIPKTTRDKINAEEVQPLAKRRLPWAADTCFCIEDITDASEYDLRYMIGSSAEAVKEDTQLSLWCHLYEMGSLQGARTPSILGGWGGSVTWSRKITIRRFDAVGP